MRVIANIDVKNDYVIKGIQLEGLRKIGRPHDIIKKFYNSGFQEIIIHDSVASYYKRNNLGELIKECFKEIFIPVTIGGGIRDLKDIKNALNCGADKVMINSQAIKNPSFLKNACDKYGSSTIISYLEVKKINNQWIIYFNNGREKTDIELNRWLDVVQKKGCGEILIKSIDNDGTLNGINYKLIDYCRNLCERPLIYAGGCSSKNEINNFKKKYKNIDLALSSLFYENKFNLNIK